MMSFGAINCNSMSVTCNNENFELKTMGIKSIGADVIFLSDIRLGEINGQNGDLKVGRAFLNGNKRSYKMYHNSTKNKRGTAILIGSNVAHEILNTYKDQTENMIILHCKILCLNLVMGAVYGPNGTDRTFFNTLNKILSENSGIPILLASDWNTTWCNADPVDNIDVRNMARTPNQINGRLLAELSAKYNLTDPFRLLYPEKIQFSYSPFGSVRKNKSRLDFFVMSSCLATYIKDCGIAEYKINKLFDHNHINLTLGKKGGNNLKIPQLNNTFLNDSLLKMSVELSALQVYSKTLDENAFPDTVNTVRDTVNKLTKIVLDCVKLREKFALEDENPDRLLLLDQLFIEFGNVRAGVPEFRILKAMQHKYDDKTIFNALMERISEKAAVKCKVNWVNLKIFVKKG
jgi:exonuclease III